MLSRLESSRRSPPVCANRRLSSVVSLALLLSAGAPAGAQGAPGGPQRVLDALRAARLDPAAAVEVAGLRLAAGPGQLRIEDGFLFPVTPVAGPAGEQVREMVFAGRARLELAAPDAIEAGQLSLFTGGPRLDERLSEAVLVIANDAAANALFGRPRAAAVDAEIVRRAQERFESWRESPERRYLAVEESVFLDAFGEPGYESYFAGWFRGEELGDFLLLVDPEAPEPVTLGQFVPVDAEDKERATIERQLQRQQRRGRLIGLRVGDLGTWDTWLSAPLAGATGTGADGAVAPFEPRHYELDVTLDGRKLELSGRARITLEATAGGHRAIPFSFSPDVRVRSARDGAGQDLFLVDRSGEALVLLPAAVAAGEDAVVELEWTGSPLEKIDTRSFVLRNTLAWYPHAGNQDRATYDATLHWPSGMDLVAAGRRTGGGKEGGLRWERRVTERPTFGVSFEIGTFKEYHAQAGDVAVTLYVDYLSSPLVNPWRDQILEAVTGSLEYYGEVFGAYPSDELTVVTAPRARSQSLLGYVTLSSAMVGDLGFLSYFLEDRRTVVAHEVAHQWWGHRVGWKGYRDQWISEAMASYSAILYARNRLEQRPWRGPTTGWQSALTDSTADGRTLESLGPVVLGERLISSRASGAYEAIVYQKGAVVLDMISRIFGEETFVKILGAIAKAVDFRSVSTEDFVALIENASGADLGPFVDQFIYGTGLPEVYYRYDFAEAKDGSWTISGVARQQSPYRYTYRVVDLGDGRLDVAREAVSQMAVAESRLVVPVQIEAYDPGKEETGGRRRKGRNAAETGNTRLQGHTLLTGGETEFHFDVPLKPVEVFFDRDHEVFGRFFNERRHPKRMAFYRGLDRAAEGDLAGAEAACREALAAATFAGADLDGGRDEKELSEEGRLLDAHIHLHLARVYLRGGHDGEASEEVAQARGLFHRDDPGWMEEEARILEARLALRRGDPRAAYDLLRKKLLRDAVEDVEGVTALAIAASALGEREAMETAMGTAADAGVDLALLETR